MSQQQIDLTRFVLRGLRLLDDGRKTIEGQWQRLTKPAPDSQPPRDRRRPPEVW